MHRISYNIEQLHDLLNKLTDMAHNLQKYPTGYIQMGRTEWCRSCLSRALFPRSFDISFLLDTRPKTVKDPQAPDRVYQSFRNLALNTSIRRNGKFSSREKKYRYQLVYQVMYHLPYQELALMLNHRSALVRVIVSWRLGLGK